MNIFILPSARKQHGFCVYKITNLVNGKFYIGKSARRICERMGGHKVKMIEGRKSKIYTAFRKYGLEMFAVSLLIQCQSDDEAYATEQRLIATLRPDYNLTDGGKGTFGRKMSEEQRSANSLMRMGHSWNKGIKKTPEHIAAIIASKRRRPRTEGEIRAQRSGAMASGKKISKPVLCVETLEKFSSQKAAVERIGGGHPSDIRKVLDNPKRSLRGYHFVSSHQKIIEFEGQWESGRHPRR